MHLVGQSAVELIQRTLPVGPSFAAECLEGLEDLALMDRGRHIAAVMHRHLDPDPAAAVEQIASGLPTRRPANGFVLLPHSFYLSDYGLPAFEESLSAQHRLTQLFTAEFSIRPFLVAYPETLVRLRLWTQDPDEHVRRLVSEGTRPRLPWATRLVAFQRDPTPVLELLEMLKDDRSEYVRRSVANNLNDIAKDHPDVVLQTCRRWAPGRERLVRRALRSLVKDGDPQALEILGYGTIAVKVAGSVPAAARIGESIRLQASLVGAGPVLVDFVVHFVKADGSNRPKVFKGGQTRLASGRPAQIGTTISLAQHTTRRHYPGVHRVDALVNGQPHSLGSFELLP